eukprot:TRINITY_DN9335_c0_g1_i1.p1 TRINITY_DN9335_c0_g1~~TRINITY_DN9335_c0_g1_i1.p1  ORF type:complete len:301 (+),score=14.21 TRINITY_DN9335_c0_g1_i1:35-937(+)
MTDTSPSTKTQIPPWLSLFAGTIAGVTGVVTGHPLDTIKVRQQAQVYKSALDCALKTVSGEGPQALYKGLLPPMIGAAGINAVLFFMYDWTCQHLVNKRLKANPLHNITEATLTEVTIAGFMGGVVQTFVVTPFELAKIKLQGQHTYSEYKGTFHCMSKIFKHNGITGLYRGFVVTMLRDAPAFGFYFWAYEYLKRHWLPENSPLSILIAGGLAGASCWLSSYPFDVVKTRIQMDCLDKPQYKGMVDCFRKTYQEGGSKIFVRGLPTTLVRGFIVNSATFYGYESCLALMGSRLGYNTDE